MKNVRYINTYINALKFVCEIRHEIWIIIKLKASLCGDQTIKAWLRNTLGKSLLNFVSIEADFPANHPYLI